MAPDNMSEISLALESRWDRLTEGSAARLITALALAVALLTVALLATVKTDSKPAIERMLHEVAVRYGIDPKAFRRMAWIESQLNPRAYYPLSNAAGLFQFTPSTARRYGLVQTFDPKANAETAAAHWLHNTKVLRRALGRNPSAGEIYLAHQQGVTGAVRLLRNPKALAITIVGRKAVTMNGGRVEMTADAFANLWIRRFHSFN